MTDLVQLGKMIRNKRKEKGITVRGINTESGMSLGYISGVENGTMRPSEDRLYWLAETLGLGEEAFRLAGYAPDGFNREVRALQRIYGRLAFAEDRLKLKEEVSALLAKYEPTKKSEVA